MSGPSLRELLAAARLSEVPSERPAVVFDDDEGLATPEMVARMRALAFGAPTLRRAKKP